MFCTSPTIEITSEDSLFISIEADKYEMPVRTLLYDITNANVYINTEIYQSRNTLSISFEIEEKEPYAEGFLYQVELVGDHKDLITIGKQIRNLMKEIDSLEKTLWN